LPAPIRAGGRYSTLVPVTRWPGFRMSGPATDSRAALPALRRQFDARGGEPGDYLMVKRAARYKHAVLAGELAQLRDGVAERGHLFLGEAPDAGHEDFLLVPQQVEHDGVLTASVPTGPTAILGSKRGPLGQR
jgi:hypothetical protein